MSGVARGLTALIMLAAIAELAALPFADGRARPWLTAADCVVIVLLGLILMREPARQARALRRPAGRPPSLSRNGHREGGPDA
jgi:hypothetical protein